jgi:hypothetical protein
MELGCASPEEPLREPERPTISRDEAVWRFQIPNVLVGTKVKESTAKMPRVTTPPRLPSPEPTKRTPIKVRQPTQVSDWSAPKSRLGRRPFSTTSIGRGAGPTRPEKTARPPSRGLTTIDPDKPLPSIEKADRTSNHPLALVPSEQRGCATYPYDYSPTRHLSPAHEQGWAGWTAFIAARTGEAPDQEKRRQEERNARAVRAQRRVQDRD